MNRKSIKFKLISFTAATAFTVLLLCGLLSSFYFLDILKRQVVEDERQKLNQAAIQIKDIQKEMILLAQTIAADPLVQKQALEEEGQEVFEFLSARQQLGTVLSKYLNIREGSYSVCVITDKTIYFSSGVNTDEDMKQEKWLKQTKNGEFSGVHEIYENKNNSMAKVVSYVMEFYDMQTGAASLGKIIVNVDYEEIIGKMTFRDDVVKRYSLTDQKGQTIGIFLPAKGSGKKGSISKISQDIPMPDGWMLSAEISDRAIVLKLRYIFVFFGIMFLSALVLLCFGTFHMVRKVLKPIDRLVEGAKQVGDGNFNFAVAVDTEDEFQKLGDTFNDMVEDIKAHIARSVEYEKTAKEMEINRLMLQINPHFIYNTLNSIVYMAQIEDRQDIVTFTKAFISLLHDTLNVDKDNMFITLEQELDNVKNYLILQNFRYANKFTAIYEIEESTLDCLVPNVFIQPLAENAVFHGICAKPGHGVLLIRSVLSDDGHVEISVEDDGAGMSQEKARALLEKDVTIKGGMRKIGIANIKERIHYIYGDDFGMEIKSQEQKGTSITIRIPYQQKEKGDI